MNCSTPALLVHHQLPESTQTHAHRVGDGIQPSHPLSSPSLPALNPSQHQGLFQWVSSPHQVAKALEFQLQHRPLQWTPRTGLLECQQIWCMMTVLLLVCRQLPSCCILTWWKERSSLPCGFFLQLLSCVWLLVTPCTTAYQAFLSFTISQSLLKLMSIESIMPSNHLSYPVSPSSPPAFNLSQHQGLIQWVFTLCIRWPKYWSFSFSISLSNEYSGLISFRMDWLDLLAVQGTRKTLLQHHSSKASILRHSAFFMVQLSHPYMTTGKTIALTSWTFVSKVMSLLFDMLSRSVKAFLPYDLVTSQRPHLLYHHTGDSSFSAEFGDDMPVRSVAASSHSPLRVQHRWGGDGGKAALSKALPLHGLSSRTVRFITWLLRAPRGQKPLGLSRPGLELIEYYLHHRLLWTSAQPRSEGRDRDITF